MPPVHVVPVPPLHVFCVFGTGHKDRETILAVAERGAVFIPKPAPDRSLLKLLRGWAAEASEPWGARLTLWTTRYQLTPKERLVLLHGVLGDPHETIQVVAGCTKATLERHITNLLEKTGDASLLKASNRLLREAME